MTKIQMLKDLYSSCDHIYIESSYKYGKLNNVLFYWFSDYMLFNNAYTCIEYIKFLIYCIRSKMIFLIVCIIIIVVH